MTITMTKEQFERFRQLMYIGVLSEENANTRDTTRAPKANATYDEFIDLGYTCEDK